MFGLGGRFYRFSMKTGQNRAQPTGEYGYRVPASKTRQFTGAFQLFTAGKSRQPGVEISDLEISEKNMTSRIVVEKENLLTCSI
jgi:hypothetical protein